MYAKELSNSVFEKGSLHTVGVRRDKMNKVIHLIVLIIVQLMVISVNSGCTAPESNITLSELSNNEIKKYENVQQCIDQGDCTGLAKMLINEDISTTLYSYLLQENSEMIEQIIIDSMLQFSNRGELDYIVKLRVNGYVSDECFVKYWEKMGIEVPEKFTLKRKSSGVDDYLVHELIMEYQRDEYALRSFEKMYNLGLFSQETHEILVEKLGFDYSDSAYMDERKIAPVRLLTIEDKMIYDKVQKYIDQGNCTDVVKLMLCGEMTNQVYECLMIEEAEVLDFVIAQAMTEFVEKEMPQHIVSLRVNGYVSDACFECYWEMLGSGRPLSESICDSMPELDLYLLYELEQICHRDDQGAKKLCEIWKSGVITDLIQEELIKRLGFDYTQV